MLLRWLVATLGLLATIALGSSARADLSSDVERVARLWSGEGTKIVRHPPLFLEHGRPTMVTIDVSATDPDGCTRVAVMGERTMLFGVALASETDGGVNVDPEAEPDPSASRVRSSAGLAELMRCGDAQADLGNLVLLLGSPRGAVEVLSATSTGRLVGAAEMLPERGSGPLAPRGEPGRPPPPTPVAERLARARQGAIDEGAARVVDVSMNASPRGTGEFVLRMGEGCHRVTLLAAPLAAAPRLPADLDAEARDNESGRLLAKDRGEAIDARLDFCLGETSLVSVRYGGAPGPAEVTALDAVFTLPEGLPTAWGATVRAGLAGALRRRGAPSPVEDPIFEALGAHGTTMVPIEVVPGACYVAAVALLRGETRGMRLIAEIGDRQPQDQATPDQDGAAIAFCADVETSARLTLDVRSSQAFWSLAVFRLGTKP